MTAALFGHSGPWTEEEYLSLGEIQETGALHLYRREGTHYVEHSVTEGGETLRLGEPVSATLRPDDLVP